MMTDGPLNAGDQSQRLSSSLEQPRRKSLISLFVITHLIAAPFAFLYVGGWRVFLPIAIVGIGFDVLFVTLNRDMAILSQFRDLPILPLPTRVLGLVYFQYSLRYLHTYNRAIREGRLKEDLQSFRWGLHVANSAIYGLALVYIGAFVFISTLQWTGSVLKAVALCLWSLYLSHYGMRWLQRQISDFLVAKYSVKTEDSAGYQSFRYPNYLL